MYTATIVRGVVTFLPAGFVPADGCYSVWRRDDAEGAPIGDFDISGGEQTSLVMIRNVMTTEGVALLTGVDPEELHDCEGDTPLAPRELEQHVEYLEGARSILEATMRGQACSHCEEAHTWEAATLLVSVEIIKMLVGEERQALQMLELLVEDPVDVMEAGFTSTQHAERLLGRLRALLEWADT